MRVLILDDEKLAAENLGEQIQSYCPEIDKTDITNSTEEALGFINTHQYDILFLDIELPVLTGLELCQSLPS